MRTFLMVAALTILASAVSQSAVALADHPLHTTRATMEFNPDTGSFEVALCVFPDDLSAALSDRAGRRIDVEKDKDLDELLKSYVDEKFKLRLRDHESQKLHWVGHELQTQQFWLYFEFLVDADVPTEISVMNTLLMEQFEDQINIAYVRFNSRQRCMTFRTDLPDWQDWKLSRKSIVASKASGKISPAQIEAK
jgi:hypothetical protein